ncbi:reverse transcriptase domain-containing protein [Tanacetum coccineum]|uniref:Reverse transcriptase domain-containing protein n=1 Tax=Tanacetum coccineum TaxID=301880 RepID=A0ABQ5C232_9ASTR
MSTHEQITNNPTSAVRNTGGRNGPQGLEEPMSDEVLREMCDKNYHQLLPLIAEKMQKEKEQKDKLNAVKARLIYGEESGIKIRSREESHYSESKTPTARTEPRRRHGGRYSRSPSPHASVFKRLKKYRSPSPRLRPRKEGGVFNRLGRKEPATSARPDSRQRSPQAKRTEVEARRRQQKGTPSRTTSQYSESEDSEGGHWKSKSRRQRSNTYEDDLSQPWTCEERNPFTPRIRHFSLPRTRMPSHVKTYDGSGDPEDHLKLFQSAAKTEGWAMPTWCHMFNSTLTGNARVWFDKLPKESIDSYEDLRTAFRENYLQQTKHIKDPVEIHHIKQRDGESTEDFMERYKAEVLDVEGAPECMRISGFMHGITHPGLIKRLYERIPRSMDEMYRMTTSFLQGEVAALSHGQRKAPSSWKPSEGGGTNQISRKASKTNKDRIFKAPPPMVTPVEKRDPNKYCEFHSDTGHSTDECMQLRKQIDEMIKAGKLSQFIKELKQNDKPKAPKKGEASGKDKPLTILMIQPWERVAKPRITQSFSPETAMSFPPLREEDGTEGPMIIEVEMGGHFVHRVYIDGGASSEVLYEHCFIKLRKEIRDQMVPATTHLIGFSGETIWPLGQIALLVKIGDEVHSTSAWMNFMVIRSPSQHNAIIGRPGIRKLRAVPSTAHGMLKFPVEGGTVTLQSSRVIPMECAMISGPSIQTPAANQVLEEKINIAIHPEYPEQTVAIGSTLTEKGRKGLCSLLKQNLDIFAWKPADMTGVPRNIAEHRLNIREGYSPVRQKKRGQAPERNKVIQEEVEKLVDAGIMKEVHYHSWLSNPVMVKKHDGTWRMCVDFKDLNNACPKDCYPLPEIDWKVESLCGYSFKCFLDAYKGYHQIKMAKEDEEKTAFITSQGIFCYSKMPFGLKNAGSTYQRLVDKAFQKQIGRNLEVYVDDLVIKSHTEEEIIRDITETFKTLRQINMKLNPKKCTFGMQEGMFLGYKVSTNGLRACPEKADAVLSLPSPRCIKDVQKLNGKLASLNRFLSKSAEKSLPFFKTLKKCTKKSDFQWTPKAEEAFKQMKKLIAELPTLTAPRENEELIIYLAAAKEAISAVLMTDREGRQIPIYFVSRTLRGPKVNYTPMEKLVLALLSASERLKRYFQAHTVVVITNQPIKQLLSSSEISGRMLKWKFELKGYDIQYRPRTAIKGQILADFIVERPEEESSDELMAEPEVLPEPCTLFTDGSSCVDGSGAGLILTNPEGEEFTYAMRFRFEATNNEAEYEALIAGLRIAEQMGVKNLQANVDSRLAANQVNGSYIAKESGMVQYLNKVKTLTKSFKEFSIKQIPRSENKKADALSKIASTSFAHLNKQVLVEELKEKSINKKEILDVVEKEGNTWMTPICEYLTKEILPEDKKKAIAIRRKAAGYYWPTMHMDARNLIRECNDRQIHRPVPKNPQQNLTPIMSPWPFYKWGIDIAGPFPEGPGKVKFLIVAIDYFTKWIEAKAVATITGNQVKKFVWDNIVCRFGLPGEIISDNGKQFRDNPFKDWCEKLCIRQCFASVKHPQANGLVERANRSLGEGIKARLDEKSKDWIEELPHVLWAHRTMIKSSNGETPFSLTYGTEAVIPAEIGMPTLRTAEIDQTKNNEALGINLDLIEERREQAAIQEAKSKKKMEKYYNSRVRGTSFKPGDMVYRSNEASYAKDGGKLGPKWEGPYEVKESPGKGAYKLKDCKGNEMPRTWNICNLKKCYIHEL